MKSITNQIHDFIETVRPYLQKEGGDFEFVEFKDGVIYIKMLGSCSTCSSSSNTIKSIEDMMCEEIPGIISVKQIY